MGRWPIRVTRQHVFPALRETPEFCCRNKKMYILEEIFYEEVIYFISYA